MCSCNTQSCAIQDLSLRKCLQKNEASASEKAWQVGITHQYQSSPQAFSYSLWRNPTKGDRKCGILPGMRLPICIRPFTEDQQRPLRGLMQEAYGQRSLPDLEGPQRQSGGTSTPTAFSPP